MPVTPTTAISGSNIVVSWAAPYYGGSVITSYVIQILKSDNSTYSVDLADCDGSNVAYLASQTCTIPITSVKALPFSLTWGSSVYV